MRLTKTNVPGIGPNMVLLPSGLLGPVTIQIPSSARSQTLRHNHGDEPMKTAARRELLGRSAMSPPRLP
jgi:hypothetical protein